MLEIREPKRSELRAVCQLAAKLVRQHRGYDPQRFFALEDPAEGYLWYFGRVLGKKRVVILAAFEGKKVLGYAYASMLPRDWDMLRDPCAGLHDLYVDERARGRGLGKLLVEAVLARLEELGAPRVVLYSAFPNEEAHRLFERLGFRRTMVEMTRELAPTRPYG
jgi:GNAT superfamily N-acetyltransferase